MGKRSDFPRRKNDAYLTPYEAALPLRKYLEGVANFAEPCCADGRLVRWVESFGVPCIYSDDIENGTDAITDPELEARRPAAIITNPPYTWKLLKPMLKRFMGIAPTWLLLESDFMFNEQSIPFMKCCTDIVPIGRVKWIEGTKDESKDSFAWYRFDIQHSRGPVLHPRQLIDKRRIRKLARPEIEYAHAA